MIEKLKIDHNYIVVKLKDEKVYKQTLLKIKILEITVKTVYIKFLDDRNYTERFLKSTFEEKYSIIEELEYEENIIMTIDINNLNI
jgi:hypothetical protein